MEGFGLPGLEAMAAGAPVVSSNATCLPEVYGDAAHYFDPTSVTDMTRAIDEVLSDDALRGSLVAKGHKKLRSYSWERMAKQTHEVYLKALKEPMKTSEQ
jgi:glycosyltransferase involved in cell wall biosynthesis